MSWVYYFLRKILGDGEVLYRDGNSLRGAEISALTPAGHWTPDSNNARDLGTSSVRWRTGYLGTSVDVEVNNATNTGVTRGLTLSHTTSNTAQAGVGAGLLFRAESGAGTLRSAGAVDAVHTDVTDGAEVSVLALYAARAGTLVEGMRVAAPASAVNSLLVNGSATGQPIEVYPQGTDSNTGLALSGKGTGSLSLRAGNGTTMLSVSNGGISAYSDSQTGASPTVNRPAGVVRVANGATSVTVTNSLVTANSHVFAAVRNLSTNNVSVRCVVPGSGSFVIHLTGDPGASNADVSFFVVNPGS